MSDTTLSKREHAVKPEIFCYNADCMQSVGILLVHDKFCVISGRLTETARLSVFCDKNHISKIITLSIYFIKATVFKTELVQE